MTRRNSRKRTSVRRNSRRRTSVQRSASGSATLQEIDRANQRLAVTLAHIAPRISKARIPNITMIAQSQAHKAATQEGETWGGGLNNTTYPRKHYALLEEMVGPLTASELGYFNDAYEAYMRWIYETSTPAMQERWDQLRLRRHEERVPLRRNSGTIEEYRGFEIEKVVRGIQMGHDVARIAGTKRPGTRILPVQYLIHYPDGGSKTVPTMKAAREYIDNYLGDA